ncbi:calpain-5-like isoform X2 [Phyllopteryx taeniolatus]|uniref:calpain-5-like isoform X2 n=1 Tax=Phyllopteryx taeniolatus TaxID=161469 RepID=UPI002AD2EE00|nr:calpain-5-like isoform X2 [Phyllopteryx taeniolatus]
MGSKEERQHKCCPLTASMTERVSDFQGQSFHKLRRACLRRGALFKDPVFPAAAQALFYKSAPPPGVTWKRPRVRKGHFGGPGPSARFTELGVSPPQEICKDPRLFVDGISTRDLHQGSLGNCWMVAAISCLASEPTLWKKVIPNHVDQEWNPKRPDSYAGIFHFRFWRFGRWTDVVVDDLLPVSGDGVLLFCRSATPREFWSALLEKAYAKVNGCYEALEGGNTAEALIDFTGGVSEPLSLNRETLGLHGDQRKALFQTLAKAHERKALITCSIRPAEGETAESVMDCGLVRGHAYGVTALRKVRQGETLLKASGTSRLFLVRMRNPWGTTDWTGAWSQRSQQWQQMSRAEREKMGLVVRDVGEFWMDFEDFCRYFTDVVVCRLVERAPLWRSSGWREVRRYGEWAPVPPHPSGPPSAGGRSEAGRKVGGREVHVDKRSRCGGCINHKDTFLHNPQFMFEVRGHEEEVLMCLQQEDRRIRKKDGGGDNLPIGFESEENRCSRVQRVVEQAASSVYMDSRSVTLKATLAPGCYVLLPTTYLPGASGHFLVRLFCHSRVRLRELKDDLPPPTLFQCFLPQPTVVTTVHLLRATGLCPPKQTAPDVYAIIRCESATVRSQVLKAEGNPEFRVRAIFYRTYPDVHISIELWSRGLLWDSILGQARLHATATEQNRDHAVALRGGRSGSGGRVRVETSSSVCLTDL